MSRILFAGTPEISVPLLRRLVSEFEVAGVLTATDKMQGRSKQLVPSPVKVAAEELGLPVLQFDSLKTEAREAVSNLNPDTLVSFAYGKIFGPKFLGLFKNTFNVHPSALPLFRGASPIQSTILNGLKTASVSVQEIGLKMDEGDIFGVKNFALSGKENTETLSDIVADTAADFVPSVIRKALEEGLKPTEQVGEVSYCNTIERQQARLDFNRTVKDLHCTVRAMYPWPKAYATAEGREIFITSVWGDFSYTDNPDKSDGYEVGSVVEVRKDRGVGIACSDGILWVNSLQLPSKKELDFKSFINGNSWIIGGKFL